MKTTHITDWNECPACGREIEFTRSYENDDADGNRGIWMEFPEVCACGWEEGEEVLKCDMCGEVTDELVTVACGDEYCVDCAKGEELADIPAEEVVTV